MQVILEEKTQQRQTRSHRLRNIYLRNSSFKRESGKLLNIPKVIKLTDGGNDLKASAASHLSFFQQRNCTGLNMSITMK